MQAQLSNTLYERVCVWTHTCTEFFFFFDFTLHILSGYLEVFRQISIRINEKWDIMWVGSRHEKGKHEILTREQGGSHLIFS